MKKLLFLLIACGFFYGLGRYHEAKASNSVFDAATKIATLETNFQQSLKNLEKRISDFTKKD